MKRKLNARLVSYSLKGIALGGLVSLAISRGGAEYIALIVIIVIALLFEMIANW